MRHASAPSAPGIRAHTFGPPSSVGAPGIPGATVRRSLRRTAVVRPTITPVLLVDDDTGFEPTDPYVRRFWIPVMGPGAVADVLRLTAAARSGRPLKLPTHITAIVAEGLARWETTGTVGVRRMIPALDAAQVRRLPPAMRTMHHRQFATRSAPPH